MRPTCYCRVLTPSSEASGAGTSQQQDPGLDGPSVSSSLTIPNSNLKGLLWLECQRPKRQNSSDDIEVLSTGTPLQQESPELYRKGTTPSDLTPDDSPLQSFPASPSSTPPLGPTCRTKSAHFSRQVSVDEERGGEIQMLLEGRGGDYLRPNSWSEDQAGGTRGVRSGTLRSSHLGSASIPEDYRGRSGGHKHTASNHKQRERWTDSPAAVSWTSHHRSHNHSSGSAKLLELDEEKLSNYEMEMKPLMRMDSYMQEFHTQKRHYSKAGACRSLAEDHRGEDRGFRVQRLRSKSQNKENFRPASSAEPTVQKLENLRFGDKAEPRLLRWDLTFSPPQKSLPVALESEEENGDELKSSTGLSKHFKGIAPQDGENVVTLSPKEYETSDKNSDRLLPP
ncbi:Junctophilin-3 [Chelonia mydas]|uniref:Junctophilin-3 n=1 Tax=Chelonia mydas TaxID=8469 RepID=M7C6R6_CHEMY|nr:Junctophilin-3 [Chelonia mydas]